ncbi:MAG: NADPH-dependent F420 reductase [Acidobacteria bacterium]|nr:NADPH-dependent F420 reductase [Acidobacteriota bacterium]
MKIAIIGSGNVGAALAKAWARAGHEIKMGVRDVSSPKVTDLLKDIGSGATAASVRDAADFGEIIVLATPWSAVQDAVKSLGDISGKVLFDCTNPFKPQLAGLEVGLDNSGGESVQAWAPNAKVVKIFSTVGAETMEDASFAQGKPAMIYCGNDPAAKQTAATLATEIGFEPFDLGTIEQARLLEPFAMIWVRLAFFQGVGRNFAFGVLKK